MTAGAAQGIFDSANSGERKVQQKAMSVAAKTIENIASVTSSLVDTGKTRVSKNIGKTTRLQSEKREYKR